MEKIVLAVDATNLSTNAIDFACYLGRLTRSRITGLVLENFVVDEKPVVRRMQGVSAMDWEIDESGPRFQRKKKLIETNIRLFTEACEKRGVRSEVICKEGSPANETVLESRYADIIIVDAATSFKTIFEGTPTDFARKIIKEAECPVIITPENFDGVDEIFFAYDGSCSSVFAIKQFTYLFPQLNDKKVIVFNVNDEAEWPAEEKERLGSWLKNYYSAVGYESVSGDSSYEIFARLFLKKNVFIVMGAYGRSAFSRFFKHSHADLLMKTITQPIFIAHH